MDSDIMLTKELINKTARELGVHKKVVSYLYDFMVEYIHKQTNATDCCSFFLPHLGTMYVKADFIDDFIQDKIKDLEKNPNNIAAKKSKIAYEHKKRALKFYVQNSGRPLSSSFHHRRENIKKWYFNKGKSIEEMQDIQNRVYKNNDDILKD